MLCQALGHASKQGKPACPLGAHSSAGKPERSGCSVLITTREGYALCVCVCVLCVLYMCSCFVCCACVCMCVLCRCGVCAVCGVYLWCVCVHLYVLSLCICVRGVCVCVHICVLCVSVYVLCVLCVCCVCTPCAHTCACGKASNVGWVQPNLDSFPPLVGVTWCCCWVRC